MSNQFPAVYSNIYIYLYIYVQRVQMSETVKMNLSLIGQRGGGKERELEDSGQERY